MTHLQRTKKTLKIKLGTGHVELRWDLKDQILQTKMYYKKKVRSQEHEINNEQKMMN